MSRRIFFGVESTLVKESWQHRQADSKWIIKRTLIIQQESAWWQHGQTLLKTWTELIAERRKENVPLVEINVEYFLCNHHKFSGNSTIHKNIFLFEWLKTWSCCLCFYVKELKVNSWPKFKYWPEGEAVECGEKGGEMVGCAEKAVVRHDSTVIWWYWRSY